MKRKIYGRATCSVAASLLLSFGMMASPAAAAPVITTVNADISRTPFTFSFLGGSFTVTGTGGFPDFLAVSTSGGGAVRTALGAPSTDFPGRGSIVYDAGILGGYASFPSLTPIRFTNGDNFLGLRVTSGGQNYYGFLFTTNARVNSYGFETAANTGITPTTAIGAPVPEPATWGMIILGFGAMGHAMRRRSSMSTRIRFA